MICRCFSFSKGGISIFSFHVYIFCWNGCGSLTTRTFISSLETRKPKMWTPKGVKLTNQTWKITPPQHLMGVKNHVLDAWKPSLETLQRLYVAHHSSNHSPLIGCITPLKPGKFRWLSQRPHGFWGSDWLVLVRISGDFCCLNMSDDIYRMVRNVWSILDSLHSVYNVCM